VSGSREEEDVVHAKPGDRIIIKGHRMGQPDRDAEVLESRGPTEARHTSSAGAIAGMTLCCSRALTPSSRNSIPRSDR
jgi:hypothetical protein